MTSWFRPFVLSRPGERFVLEEKIFSESNEPITSELVTLVLRGSSFDFLDDEPDPYSSKDGRPTDAAY